MKPNLQFVKFMNRDKNQIGTKVRIKKGMPRMGEIGVLVKFEYLPIPEIYAWLIEFENNERGYYQVDKFIKL